MMSSHGKVIIMINSWVSEKYIFQTNCIFEIIFLEEKLIRRCES